MAPSQWWSVYGKHVTLLAALAQQVLSQSAAASAAERNWSVYGQIHSQARSSMSHHVADKLVYCHEPRVDGRADACAKCWMDS
mmetsp:Transcript_28713/g.87999  ORF Transcript_28713/g.87999 Transcript_28713/m.87999 type:complete len:83 (-) Transcript_28713:183-431(-)